MVTLQPRHNLHNPPSLESTFEYGTTERPPAYTPQYVQEPMDDNNRNHMGFERITEHKLARVSIAPLFSKIGVQRVRCLKTEPNTNNIDVKLLYTKTTIDKAGIHCTKVKNGIRHAWVCTSNICENGDVYIDISSHHGGEKRIFVCIIQNEVTWRHTEFVDMLQPGYLQKNMLIRGIRWLLADKAAKSETAISNPEYTFDYRNKEAYTRALAPIHKGDNNGTFSGYEPITEQLRAYDSLDLPISKIDVQSVLSLKYTKSTEELTGELLYKKTVVDNVGIHCTKVENGIRHAWVCTSNICENGDVYIDISSHLGGEKRIFVCIIQNEVTWRHTEFVDMLQPGYLQKNVLIRGIRWLLGHRATKSE